MLVGVALEALLFHTEAAEAQHSFSACIAADIAKVDGNDPREMNAASGEHLVRIPRGWAPVGAAGSRAAPGW